MIKESNQQANLKARTFHHWQWGAHSQTDSLLNTFTQKQVKILSHTFKARGFSPAFYGSRAWWEKVSRDDWMDEFSIYLSKLIWTGCSFHVKWFLWGMKKKSKCALIIFRKSSAGCQKAEGCCPWCHNAHMYMESAYVKEAVLLFGETHM